MFSMRDLPNTIAIFPLSRTVLLPQSSIPLNIFEPRYLTMLDDALKTSHRLIGMIQPIGKPGQKEKGLYKIGCAGRVTQFSETEDGRYMITLKGVARYRIQAEITGFTPYRRCDVLWDGFDADLAPAEIDTGFDRSAFWDVLVRYFEAMSLSTDWDLLREADDEMLINVLSMLCPFGAEEKQALLEAPSLRSRRETLVTLIEFAMRQGTSEEILQ